MCHLEKVGKVLVIYFMVVQFIPTKVDAIQVMCPISNALFKAGHCLKCVHGVEISQSNFDCFSDHGRNWSIMPHREVCCLIAERNLQILRIRQATSFLNGKQLKVVTIVRPPFITLNGSIYSGVIFEFLKALQTKYNFSIKAFPPYDGNWGANVNGTWNGMIGMTIRKEADLGAAAFSVTLERSRAIDFTVAIHQEPSAILIPPPNSGEKFTVLIRPLSKQVWAAVFGTIFILIPSLYVFHRIDNKILGSTEKLGLSDLIWFLVGSILQQGLYSPVERSSRFVTGIWWAMTLVLANIYIAFLVSYLSNPKLHNIVDSLEGLSKQNRLKWTFRTNTAHRSLFKSEGAAGTYKIIGARALDSDLVAKDTDGVEQVLRGKFAFIKEKSFLDVAIANDFEKVHKCRITLAKEDFFTVGLALVLEKKSHFTDLFDYEISTAVATGIMEFWKRLHWPNPRQLVCNDAASYIIATQPKAKKLKFDDVQGAYFLLACGIIFSTLAFSLEHFNARASHNCHHFRLTWKISRMWRFLR